LIFVTLGSQKFQFNRLLKYVDELIEEGIIKEKVYAQIGYSDYIPQNFEYKQFLSRDEFSKRIDISNIIITHGGTGTIITALKKGKKVIAMARIAEFGEHVDDHQIQVVKELNKLRLIVSVESVLDLKAILKNISDIQFEEYISSFEKLMGSLKRFIES